MQGVPEPTISGPTPTGPDWHGGIEAPDDDAREQNTPVAPDTYVVPDDGTERPAALLPSTLPLDSASEFDAADQAVEIPFDEDDL